ncbi:MAG: type II secretion system F family protein [Actinomycetia bacterium]|nr:type II secretion system F family protein [Actinomycetes bacterium]
MNIKTIILSISMGVCAFIITYFLLLRPARLKWIEKRRERSNLIKDGFSNFYERHISSSKKEEYNDLFQKLKDFKFFGYKVKDFSDFLTLKVILVGFALLYSLILPLPKIIIIVSLAILAFKLPDIKLKRELKTIEKNVKYELPYIAEIIALGIKSGMDFNESVSFLINNTKGKTTDLLREGYFNFSAGGGEEKSYLKAAKKSLCEEFVNLIKTVFQSKKLGVPVSEAILRLAENIRYKNSIDLKLKIERIPIFATLIIMAFFFFPVLIATVAPVISEIIKLFIE